VTAKPQQAPNGLKISRPASPMLVSRQSRTPGWPGRSQILASVQGSIELLGGAGLRGDIVSDELEGKTGDLSAERGVGPFEIPLARGNFVLIHLFCDQTDVTWWIDHRRDARLK